MEMTAKPLDHYARDIEQLIRDLKVKGVISICEQIDPRHVEASMLLQYGTLDHLPTETFRDEILLFREMMKAPESTAEMWESTAQSYGL